MLLCFELLDDVLEALTLQLQFGQQCGSSAWLRRRITTAGFVAHEWFTAPKIRRKVLQHCIRIGMRQRFHQPSGHQGPAKAAATSTEKPGSRCDRACRPGLKIPCTTYLVPFRRR